MDIKKVTQKDRYGNQVSFEFESPVKPLDQTAIVKDMMEKSMDESMEVPMMSMEIDHPGEPRGTDTVPAWLTPGEFVVNKEAMDIPGNAEIVEEINNDGRAIQAKKGMEVPGYDIGGKVSKLYKEGYTAPGQAYAIAKDMGYQNGGDVPQPAQLPFLLDLYSKLSGVGQQRADVNRTPMIVKKTPEEIAKSEAPWWESNPDLFKNDGGYVDPHHGPHHPQAHKDHLTNELVGYYKHGDWITDELLDQLRLVESGGRNDLVSKAGAVGEYQWLPSSAKQAGYGVKAFDPLDPKAARKATKQYLKNMQKYHGFTPEETLRAYNWGPGNVLKHKAGKRKDIPDEALNYPGKILGWDKVEGVPAPAGMPTPKARPDVFQKAQKIYPYVPTGYDPTDDIDDITNPDDDRIRPIPPLEGDEDDSFMNVLKEFFKGGGREYNMGGPVYMENGGWFDAFRDWNRKNEARNVDKRVKQDLALNPSIVGDDPVADYEGEFGVPEAPNLVGDDPVGEYPLPGGTVVPALTDVPKGHQMFGGNENFAGPVKQGPEEKEIPWYNSLLGPNLKDESTLTEADKGFLDKQTSTNELLASAQLAEEENNIADGNTYINDMESDIVSESKTKENTGKGPQVDDFGETTKNDIKDKVLNKIDINSKEADGPGEDQKGDNKSDDEVKKAGEANPDIVGKAGNFLKETFGDLFDTKELARMAVMYAGSRVLGYGHQGSLRFAAKNYIKRVDAKFANRDAFIKSNAKNFTPASLEAYRKSGDLSQLVKPGTPANRTGEYKTFYGPNGAVKAEKVKIGDNTVWSTDGGKTAIDGTKFNEDPAYIKGTKENKTMVNNFISRTTDQLKSLRGQFDRFGTGDEIGYKTDINPATSSGKIAEWAVKNGVKPEELSGLVESAYHDAINDNRQDGSRARNLVPYLNQLVIRQKVGNPDLFLAKGYDPEDKGAKQYVNAQKLQTLNKSVAHVMKIKGKKGGTQDLANQFYNAALRDWNKLSTKEQESYIGKALDDESGFYKFIETQALKYAQ